MKTKQADWRFVGWWVLAATVLFIIDKLLRYLNVFILELYEPQIFTELIGNTIGIFLQWLVIRPYIKNKLQLLIFTGLGSITTFIVSSLFEHYYSSHYWSLSRQSFGLAKEWSNNTYFGFSIAQIIVLGLIYSFFQWLVFRKESSRSKWWLVANPSIYAVRFIIAIIERKIFVHFYYPEGFKSIMHMLLPHPNFNSMIMRSFKENIIYHAIRAACVGIFLMWMLQKPILVEEVEIEEI